ncbi:hypothetical protein WJX73_004696 [Symbiochloris irregularis]|uniref:J domain-containing protein n=1 Tax=Symbiochloris irregularis TaxID=706552 RepID=A0AAW1NZI2_9CHLO
MHVSRENGMEASTSSRGADGEEFSLNDVFSLRRPRDVGAGLSSGTKSAAKGVAAGVLGLVAAPIAGAVTNGFGGFAKGVGLGVVGAVILPVVGVGVGLTQVGRGIYNTPEAIREAARGRFWNHDLREWQDQPVLALAVGDDTYADTRQRWHDNRNEALASASTDSTDFYALLGVSRDASADAIKRQYYVLARRMHPDKNQGDPEAKEKFQRLGEAYQVLGNPELRERYDRSGAEGLDVNFMDSAAFFVMLFGSDRFEHLVGELTIAAVARTGGDIPQAQMKRMQENRELKLAELLTALLRRWVEGDHVGFLESMGTEARELAQASWGVMMLTAIGRVYSLQGEIGGGNAFNGFIANMRQRGQTVKTHASMAMLAVKVFRVQARIEKLDQPQDLPEADAAALEALSPEEREARQQAHSQARAHRGLAEAEKARLEEASLPLMMDAWWAANLIDIQTTVRHTCRRVLKDQSASRDVRLARAKALRELGRLFCEAAETQLKTQSTRKADPKQQMEDAMQKVIEKRHEMDDLLHAKAQH